MADTQTIDRPPFEAVPIDAILRAAVDAASDGMVERLATTASNALEVVDRLNNDDTKAAILAVLDAVTEMHRSGALGTVIDLVSVMHAAREATTDGMVERLVTFVESMISNLATDQIAMLAKTTECALQDAAAEVAAKEKVSIFALMGELRKPETLRMMSFLLSFGKKFYENSDILAHRPASHL